MWGEEEIQIFLKIIESILKIIESALKIIESILINNYKWLKNIFYSSVESFLRRVK
jgi:hypothetical protein